MILLFLVNFILLLYAFTGFLGVHLVNGTNEVNHIKDAVNVIGNAFAKLLTDDNISPPPTECKDVRNWDDGEKVFK